MSFGGAEEHQIVKDMQKEIQFDDPVNIQFTSVSKIDIHGSICP